MKAITRASLFILGVSACAFAQKDKGVWLSQNLGPGPVTIRAGGFGQAGGFGKSAAPVQGAPYSATIKNESVQTLADGNHIKQSSTGTVARDSQGRTRQDTTLPAIGNLSATDAPHLVFIHDPVAQKSYTLNLTDKTAHEMPPLPPPPPGGAGPGGPDMVFMQVADGPVVAGQVPAPQGGDVAIAAGPLPPPPARAIAGREITRKADKGQVTTEDLGSQTMEGVYVTGIRTTRSIPAGQIGNEKPIAIVTEVWTSPDLKTIVYSKRTDPRMGEQIFQLTNITRNEPDPSLFTVPSDFKVNEGKTVIYRTNP
jgi:hypothetical protein